MKAPKTLSGLATGAFALTLGLWAAPTSAQDGSPPGPPVTNSKTNTQNPKADTPKRPGSNLPGVPATARDPAPPGTRAVRVDRPASSGTADRPGDARKTAANARGILRAEGVVTRIDRAGKTVNGELERFAFDPSQDWMAYVSKGVTGIPEKGDDRPKTTAEQKAANVKQHEDDSDAPTVLEMVITKRTYTYTHARSEDGTDLYAAATSASPDTRTSTNLPRNGSSAGQVATPDRPTPTNFTNIKEGSFVSVRYRKVGDVNEVLNLTIIDLPLNPVPAESSAARPAAGARTPVVPLNPTGTDLPK